MTTKYAGKPLYDLFNITEPVTNNTLYDIYGVTEYPTDSTTYTHLYKTSRDSSWMEEVSTENVTILYDDESHWYFISNRFNDNTRDSRWFSLDWLAKSTYDNTGNLESGLSLSNTPVTVYDVATWGEHNAVSFTDPADNILKYLVKDISYDNFKWLTENELDGLGYSLYPPPPVEEGYGITLLDNVTGEVYYNVEPHDIDKKVQGVVAIEGNIEHIGLPEVSFTGDFVIGEDNVLYVNNGDSYSIQPNGIVPCSYFDGYTYLPVKYNPEYSYSIINWYEDSSTIGGTSEVIVDRLLGNLVIKNVSENTVSLVKASVAVCYSAASSVIKVYALSDNSAFNAFKMLYSGIEYYYVLDGVHRGWLTDIISAGYSPYNLDEPIDFLFGLSWSNSYSRWSSVQFSYSGLSNKWYSGIMSERDKTLIESLGLTTAIVSGGGAGTIGAVLWNDNYTFEPIAFYSDTSGTNEVQMSLSDFECIGADKTSSGGYSIKVVMPLCSSYYTLSTTTWKCRISKKQATV